MNYSQNGLQVCALKVNLNCDPCQRKVKKQLQKLHGVQSIDIDAKEGRVTIYSTLDPDILIAVLAKAGKKAELLWESKLQENNQSQPKPEPELKDVLYAPPIDAQSQPDELDFHKAQLAHLQELAKNKGLKQLELTTHSRNIKMIFKDHNEDNPISHATPDYCSKVGMDEPPSPPPPPGGGISSHRGGCPSQSSNVGGGGPCPVTKPPPASCSYGVDFLHRAGPGQFSKRTMRSHGLPPLTHYPHRVPRPISVLPPYYGPHPPSIYHVPAGPSPSNALYADVTCHDERNACSVM